MINSFTANKKGNQWTVTLVAKTNDLTDIFKDLMYLLEPEAVSPDKPSVSPDKPLEQVVEKLEIPPLQAGIVYEPRRDVRTNIQGIVDCLKRCSTDLAFQDARPIRRDILSTLSKYAYDALQGIDYEDAKDAYVTSHYNPGSACEEDMPF
jgi:hypothetical protein